ncbi:MAG: hypothetical protein ACRDOV_01165 [Streptomyces sp.]
MLFTDGLTEEHVRRGTGDDATLFLIEWQGGPADQLATRDL